MRWIIFLLSFVIAAAYGLRVIRLCAEAARRLSLDEDKWRFKGMVLGPIALLYLRSALSPSDADLRREISRVLLVFGALLAWIVAAINLFDQRLLPTSDPWASNMRVGVKAYEQGRYSEAEIPVQAALREAEKAFGPQDRRVAETLYYLAIVHYHQGRGPEAESLYRRALAIYESYENQPGADERLYRVFGFALNDLASLYSDQGQYERAEVLFQRSLAVREKAFGSEHWDVGRSLHNLAILYRRWGRYSEAEPLARRALSIAEAVKGPESRDVGRIVHELGHIYEAQGKLVEAEPLFRRGLAIDENALGTQHPQVAQDFEDYAGLLRKMGREGEAGEFDARAQAIRHKLPKNQ